MLVIRSFVADLLAIGGTRLFAGTSRPQVGVAALGLRHWTRVTSVGQDKRPVWR